MLSLTDELKQAWLAQTRKISARVTIETTVYNADKIMSVEYDSGSISGETFQIGSFYQNSIKVVLVGILESLTNDNKVKLEFAIDVNGSFSWTNMGIFYVSEFDRDRNSNRTSFTAVDGSVYMGKNYTPTITFPNTLANLTTDIANQCGVAINYASITHLADISVSQPPSKYTCRQIIGMIAQIHGGFARMNRSDELEVTRLTDTSLELNPSNYMLKGLTKNETTYRVDGMIVKVGDNEDDKIQIGATSGSSLINLENPLMTQALLNDIWGYVSSINYYPFELKWRGIPNLEAGDWITIVDKHGNRFRVPNLSYKLSFKGSLSATSSARTTAISNVQHLVKGTLTQRIEDIESYTSANGFGRIYTGLDEPDHNRLKIGDVWFKKENGITHILVWDGEQFVEKTNTGDFEELKQAFDEIDKKTIQLDEEVKEHNAYFENINNHLSTSDANIQNAIERAQSALADAEEVDGKLTLLKNTFEHTSELFSNEIEKIQGETSELGTYQAWANSEDGILDFTRQLPNDNFFPYVQGEVVATDTVLTRTDWDIAKAVDLYGLDRDYTLSFDVKGTYDGYINVYTSSLTKGARYSIGAHTYYIESTGFKKIVIKVHPELMSTKRAKALVTISVGKRSRNRPIVKNMKFELDKVATVATPTLEDIKKNLLIRQKILENTHEGQYDLTAIFGEGNEPSKELVAELMNPSFNQDEYIAKINFKYIGFSARPTDRPSDYKWMLATEYLNQELTQTRTLIKQTKDEIDLIAESLNATKDVVEQSKSEISVLADQISLKVDTTELNRVDNALTQLSASIQLSENSILQEVSRVESVANQEINNLSADLTTVSSRVGQLADSYGIAILKNKEDILTELNLTQSGITLKGELIKLDGQVTIEDAFVNKLKVNQLMIDEIEARAANIANLTVANMDVSDAFVIKLKANNIFADYIQSKSAEIANLAVSNLNADNIKSGYIRSDRIAVSMLSSLTNDMGIILAGKIQNSSTNPTFLIDADLGKISSFRNSKHFSVSSGDLTFGYNDWTASMAYSGLEISDGSTSSEIQAGIIKVGWSYYGNGYFRQDNGYYFDFDDIMRSSDFNIMSKAYGNGRDYIDIRRNNSPTSSAYDTNIFGIAVFSSDERLKTNIQDVSDELSLSKINQLRVKSFDWIKNGQHEPFGIIAQDVEKVLPMAVFKPGEYYQIYEPSLIPVLIGAIKALSSKVDWLESIIENTKIGVLNNGT